jgi:hypothetical protein
MSVDEATTSPVDTQFADANACSAFLVHQRAYNMQVHRQQQGCLEQQQQFGRQG